MGEVSYISLNFCWILATYQINFSKNPILYLELPAVWNRELSKQKKVYKKQINKEVGKYIAKLRTSTIHRQILKGKASQTNQTHSAKMACKSGQDKAKTRKQKSLNAKNHLTHFNNAHYRDLTLNSPRLAAPCPRTRHVDPFKVVQTSDKINTKIQLVHTSSGQKYLWIFLWMKRQMSWIWIGATRLSLFQLFAQIAWHSSSYTACMAK